MSSIANVKIGNAIKINATVGSSSTNAFRTSTKIKTSAYQEGTIEGEPTEGSVVIYDSDGKAFYIRPVFDGGNF